MHHLAERMLSPEESRLYALAEWAGQADGDSVKMALEELESHEQDPKNPLVTEAFYYALSEMYIRLYTLAKANVND